MLFKWLLKSESPPPRLQQDNLLDTVGAIRILRHYYLYIGQITITRVLSIFNLVFTWASKYLLLVIIIISYIYY